MAIRTLKRWADHIVVGPLRPILQNPKRILREHVKLGMTVLDVGCGDGYFSLGMAEMVGSDGRVISVDLDKEKIQSLTKRAAKADLSTQIEARICSARSLDIDDFAGQIDFALAFYVVHHADDVPGLMTQVHTALKPGGRFMIVEPSHQASVEECDNVISEARQAGFSPDSYPRLLRNWTVLLGKD